MAPDPGPQKGFSPGLAEMDVSRTSDRRRHRIPRPPWSALLLSGRLDAGGLSYEVRLKTRPVQQPEILSPTSALFLPDQPRRIPPLVSPPGFFFNPFPTIAAAIEVTRWITFQLQSETLKHAYLLSIGTGRRTTELRSSIRYSMIPIHQGIQRRSWSRHATSCTLVYPERSIQAGNWLSER